MRHTSSDVLRETTKDYLATITQSNPPPPEEIEEELLSYFAAVFRAENALREKGERWKIPARLPAAVIADIMAALHNFCTIRTGDASGDREYDLLAMYETSGPNEGIYVTDEEGFFELAKQYDYQINDAKFKEVIRHLRSKVPIVKICDNKDFIAVNNGIFDYNTKQLLPFSPEYVFTSKSHVNYNPNAANVVIHNPDDGTDWDVESWMQELSDDPEIVDLLWHILGAIIRPNVSWNKSAWFYSESGNNGKGTLCELMRQLCGDGTHVSIPLSDMGKDFALEPLIRASAIIVDENNVGTYIDKAANLKAIITGDIIQINRKFKVSIAYRPRCFMVQCLNELVRTKDRSDSFWRRQLFVPFTKCFTGRERKYIKDEYLRNKDVLEYVLFKVLNMLPDYYNLPIPAACVEALEEYKEFNDPVRSFLNEMLPRFVWDLVPYSFLYDLYKAWFSKNSPSGTIQGRNSFISDIRSIIRDYPAWNALAPTDKLRTSGRIVDPEPLISEYNLTEWMNPGYVGRPGYSEQKCRPQIVILREKYSGLVKLVSTQND